MKLKNKVAIVTGASEGLGKSITLELAKEKVKVALLARSKNKIADLKKEISSKGVECESYVCDVSDAKQVTKAVRDVESKFGRIDILVNNAGVWIEGQVQDNSASGISSTIDINLKGVIYLTRAVLSKMLQRNEGFIINVSSTSGLRGRKNQAVYVASKYGVTGFTKSLQLDLAETNIKVAGFYPGGMRTKMFEEAGFPKDNKGWMDTDKVAKVIVFILKQDETMILDQVVLKRRSKQAST
jgi:short-subunit dehydrogenase